MTSTSQPQELSDTPVAVALLAGGIGSAVLGLMTLLAEASTNIKTALTWSKPVGALAGKTGWAVIAFFVSWIVMHFVFRGKNVNFARFTTFALILLVFALLATFPPFFDLFAP